MLATFRSATVKLLPARYARPAKASLRIPSGFLSSNSSRSAYDASRADSVSSARCCSRSSSNASISRTAQKRSEEHTSELQSHLNLVCRLLLEKKKIKTTEMSEQQYSERLYQM